MDLELVLQLFYNPYMVETGAVCKRDRALARRQAEQGRCSDLWGKEGQRTCGYCR